MEWLIIWIWLLFCPGSSNFFTWATYMQSFILYQRLSPATSHLDFDYYDVSAESIKWLWWSPFLYMGNWSLKHLMTCPHLHHCKFISGISRIQTWIIIFLSWQRLPPWPNFSWAPLGAQHWPSMSFFAEPRPNSSLPTLGVNREGGLFFPQSVYQLMKDEELQKTFSGTFVGFFFVMRLLKVCPFNKFQVCNKVFLTIVALLSIRVPELIHLAYLKLCIFDWHLLSPSQVPGNHHSILCFHEWRMLCKGWNETERQILQELPYMCNLT